MKHLMDSRRDRIVPGKNNMSEANRMIQSSSKLISGVVLFATSLTASAEEIDFQRDIAPILEERCIYCHGEDEQESGLRLDRRADMLRGGDSGLAAVVAGKPEESYLIEVVKHLDPKVKMPNDTSGDGSANGTFATIQRGVDEAATLTGDDGKSRGCFLSNTAYS